MSLRTKSFVISLENYCEGTRRAIRLGRCIFARVSHVLERERERGRSFKMKKRFRFYVEKGESNDGRERKEKKIPYDPRKSEERDSGKICEFGRLDASNISGSRKFFAKEGMAVSTLRGLPISAHRASGLRTRILRTYLFWQALLRDPILPLA